MIIFFVLSHLYNTVVYGLFQDLDYVIPFCFVFSTKPSRFLEKEVSVKVSKYSGRRESVGQKLDMGLEFFKIQIRRASSFLIEV